MATLYSWQQKRINTVMATSEPIDTRAEKIRGKIGEFAALTGDKKSRAMTLLEEHHLFKRDAKPNPVTDEGAETTPANYTTSKKK